MTAAICDHIESVYQENSPERIYFHILYNIFHDFLEEIDRGRAAERSDRLQGQPRLEQAVQLPAGRGDRHHQQAGDAQRLHSGGQRRPRKNLHRAGGHQILRASQSVGSGSLPEETCRQLAKLQHQSHDQHLREGPLQLRRPVPHRSLAHLGRVVRHSAESGELGQLRPRRHRRVAQFPQQRCLQGPGDALPEADEPGHPRRREDQGSDAFGDAGEQSLQ